MYAYALDGVSKFLARPVRCLAEPICLLAQCVCTWPSLNGLWPTLNVLWLRPNGFWLSHVDTSAKLAVWPRVVTIRARPTLSWLSICVVAQESAHLVRSGPSWPCGTCPYGLEHQEHKLRALQAFWPTQAAVQPSRNTRIHAR